MKTGYMITTEKDFEYEKFEVGGTYKDICRSYKYYDTLDDLRKVILESELMYNLDMEGDEKLPIVTEVEILGDFSPHIHYYSYDEEYGWKMYDCEDDFNTQETNSIRIIRKLDLKEENIPWIERRYDKWGNLTYTKYPDEYDEDGNEVISRQIYTYDDNGNILTMYDTDENSFDCYKYDDQNNKIYCHCISEYNGEIEDIISKFTQIYNTDHRLEIEESFKIEESFDSDEKLGYNYEKTERKFPLNPLTTEKRDMHTQYNTIQP